MSRVLLVVFDDRFGGETRAIAEFVAELAKRRGFGATIVEAEALPRVELRQHHAVVVIAPGDLGRHSRTIRRLLRDHAELLSTIPTAFVADRQAPAPLSPAARAAAEALTRAFLDRIGVRARLVLLLDRAPTAPRNGLLLRLRMRLAALGRDLPDDAAAGAQTTDRRALERAFEAFFDVLALLLRLGEAHAAGARPTPTPSTDRWAPAQSGVFLIPRGGSGAVGP